MPIEGLINQRNLAINTNPCTPTDATGNGGNSQSEIANWSHIADSIINLQNQIINLTEIVEDIEVGDGSATEVWYAYGGQHGDIDDTFATTARYLRPDDEVVASSSYSWMTYAVTGSDPTDYGQITFDEAGLYLIGYRATIVNDGPVGGGDHTDTIGFAVLFPQADTGSGYAAMSGALGYSLASDVHIDNSITTNTGNTAMAQFLFSAAVGDKVRVAISRQGASSQIEVSHEQMWVQKCATPA